jgi:hypothetical protein
MKAQPKGRWLLPSVSRSVRVAVLIPAHNAGGTVRASTPSLLAEGIEELHKIVLYDPSVVGLWVG